MCCSVLQCVAADEVGDSDSREYDDSVSVLQCVAMCCNVCYNVLQRVAADEVEDSDSR